MPYAIVVQQQIVNNRPNSKAIILPIEAAAACVQPLEVISYRAEPNKLLEQLVDSWYDASALPAQNLLIDGS
jgi:hypothetical protein